MERMKECKNNQPFKLPDESDLKIKLLKRLLAALNGNSKFDPLDLEKLKTDGILDLRSPNFKLMDQNSDMREQINGTSEKTGEQKLAAMVGTTRSGTLWHKITATSGFYNESEMTSFATTGVAVTEDGRNINFGIEVNMSRSFTAKVDYFKDETYIKTDPLMINLDTNVGSVSDMKFTFDLNADGRAEEISFAGEGSGFIALDKNGDGKINDGSELFGTKSGDGFADLAAYDEDGNNWIDENDSIYKDLRVWTKDADGNDKLIDLKSADVGAIYLGNVSTEFSLKNDANHTNGIIQKTGVYLKESGGVGTVNHVDLTL